MERKLMARANAGRHMNAWKARTKECKNARTHERTNGRTHIWDYVHIAKASLISGKSS